MNPLLNQLNNQPQTNNIQKVIEMIKGKNPQEVFYEECKKRGIDANVVINIMKNMR